MGRFTVSERRGLVGLLAALTVLVVAVWGFSGGGGGAGDAGDYHSLESARVEVESVPDTLPRSVVDTGGHKRKSSAPRVKKVEGKRGVRVPDRESPLNDVNNK